MELIRSLVDAHKVILEVIESLLNAGSENICLYYNMLNLDFQKIEF